VKVTEWSLPDNAIPDIPLTATWINESTLIFTEPDHWNNGMPATSSLMRLTIDGAKTNVKRLTEIDSSGSDRGVAVVDVTLSHDRAQIAYRLRHFTELAADHGRRDTIHVMSVDDVTRSIEVARGTPGDGLSWSPDSQWLVADIGQRVALLSPDGRTLDYLTPDSQRASNPFWVDEHEVWFSVEGGAIWRVVMVGE
jgi:hypothetical protein